MSEQERELIVNLIDKKSNIEYEKSNIMKLDLLNDLGFNSISFIELIVELESVFNIEFDDEMLLIEKLSSAEKICSAVEEILGRK